MEARFYANYRRRLIGRDRAYVVDSARIADNPHRPHAMLIAIDTHGDQRLADQIAHLLNHGAGRKAKDEGPYSAQAKALRNTFSSFSAQVIREPHKVVADVVDLELAQRVARLLNA